jgi:methionyl-tRNA synthetase
MKYLITSALPYANGPLHFGHLAGVYIPADVYTRHRKMQGEDAIHISGSDEHGVAIMLNAQKDKKDYQQYVDEWHLEHKNLFENFNIHFEYFGQTSSKYHEEEVLKWFNSLHEKGMIEPRDMQQLQCQDCSNHLPDRFVVGECYECHHPEARGDECPNCGIIIDSVKLIKPVCQICKSTNIVEVTVTQYYLLLSKAHSQFRNWLENHTSFWKKTVGPYVDSLTKENLVDRAISRDLDWGIDVPLAQAVGKKLYVWFDAPIGYISNTKEWLKLVGSKEDYKKDWWQNSETKIEHFIGKDNIIFHCVIFPVMCLVSEQSNVCYDVPANQYLNLEGKQFSKSSGWYVDAKTAVEEFGSDSLRYYLLSILPENSDSSFTWNGFQAKVNGELANNIGNLVNRCLKFWKKNWPEGIEAEVVSNIIESDEGELLKNKLSEVRNFLSNKEIKKALEVAMSMGHFANEYFSEQAPWAQFKEDPKQASETIAKTGSMILILACALRPFLPNLSQNIISLFGEVDESTINKIYQGDISSIKEIYEINSSPVKMPKALVPKIDDELIEKLNNDLNSLT